MPDDPYAALDPLTLAREVHARRLSSLPLHRLEQRKPSYLRRMLRRADARKTNPKGATTDAENP